MNEPRFPKQKPGFWLLSSQKNPVSKEKPGFLSLYRLTTL
jgi:hypothetical protein